MNGNPVGGMRCDGRVPIWVCGRRERVGESEEAGDWVPEGRTPSDVVGPGACPEEHSGPVDRRAECFAGIDGGGTRTLCLVYCPGTGAVALGTGGPLNPNYIPAARARTSIRESLCNALDGAGLDGSGLRCLAAAAPWAEDLVRAVVSDVVPRASVLTPGEDVLTLLGGTLRDHGLVLIAGTGSRCAYVPPAGDGHVISGAWGSLFGDEGSGYDIGRMALHAVTRAWDGRSPATLLAELITSSWSLRRPKDLLATVYSSGRGSWRRRIASACPLVGQAARAGDPVAVEILDTAAAELALLVESVVRRTRLKRPAEVLISGGVFALGDLIVRPLSEELASGPTATVTGPLFPPVCGALFAAMAAGQAGMQDGAFRPDPSLTCRLREVLPEAGKTVAGGWR